MAALRVRGWWGEGRGGVVTAARGHRGKEGHDGKAITARLSADEGMLLIDRFMCLAAAQAEAGDVSPRRRAM